jgi:hypothetical protein
MKLFRVDMFEPDGVFYSWHKTRADAEQALNQWRAEGSGDHEDAGYAEPVNIPADRDGLLAWLNRHFASDNG